MERPAYKLKGKSRVEERIYINKEALIYSGCGSKEGHYQICDSICAASDNEVYVINKRKLINVSFTEEEVGKACVIHNKNFNSDFSQDLHTRNHT